MKHTIATLTLLFFMVAGLQAQTAYKFGHIDSQKLITSLPESEQAQNSLEAEAKSMQDRLETMQVEYNNKVNDYVNNDKLAPGDAKKWSDLIKADKEKEIQDLGRRIQEFQETASQEMQNKKNDLYKPIIEKVDKAIKDVDKENKFTYIFDVAAVLYYSEESIDITSMVKAKLAVK
jgi:outer membrane protein